MDTSSKSKVSLLAMIMALAMTAGCSAEQPPAQADEAAIESAAADLAATSAAVADEAQQAAEAVVESAPIEVAASDEEPPADEIMLAQADLDEGQDQTAEEAKPSAAPAKPAGPAPYRVGDHYSVLSPAQPTSAEPGKVEITEFFMYGCPHCYNFEAFIEKWEAQKAPYVQFVRFPALFNKPARAHARAFYTAETLGILDDTHMPFFRELHVSRKAMTSDEDLYEFFANFGIDKATFSQTFNSFAVDTQLRKAEALGRRYRITSTPTVIVNGKYVIDGDKITSYEQILKIADYLAQKEASGG